MGDSREGDIPLADDENAEEVTEVDILKLNLGSNKLDSIRASGECRPATNGGDSLQFSLPYGSNSSNSPAQPSCK